MNPIEQPSPPQPRIARALLRWFERHGRNNLPWQQAINPYRVWLSEIMLQQTQVATVIPYYQRFLQQLPDLQALASADENQVLHLWTGLGYYSRARNLQQTARLICQQHGGQFPDTLDTLCSLPGIGRSTAGAILSIAFGQRAAILDGNVKRVLARYHAIAGWPGDSATLKQLWSLAEWHTPKSRCADYSQAIMDLGATLCTRSRPNCPQCPLRRHCQALATDSIAHYPGRKAKKALPTRQTHMLLIENPDGEILLQRQPANGLWGGLWLPPQTDQPSKAQLYCEQQLGCRHYQIEHWPSFRHSFSHFHLEITPLHIRLSRTPTQSMEAGRQLWYNRQQPPAIGLAAPIKSLIAKLDQPSK